MNQTLRKLIGIVVVLGGVAACGQFAQAVPTCPPLCLLPPDPAPPMPPINYPDPPFNPVAPQNPNNNKGKGTASAVAMPMGRRSHVTVAGRAQAGAECRSGMASGTLVPQSNGKYLCNFTPSTLKLGAACHAKKKIGTVTVVQGKRYCKIPPG